MQWCMEWRSATRCACWPTLCSKCAAQQQHGWIGPLGLAFAACPACAACAAAGWLEHRHIAGLPHLFQVWRAPACVLAYLPACLPTHAPSLGPALALLPLPCFLQVWAVRDVLCELLLGVPAHNLSAGPFYGATLLLVAAAYAISVMVPSIYVSVSAAMLARGSAVLPAQG